MSERPPKTTRRRGGRRRDAETANDAEGLEASARGARGRGAPPSESRDPQGRVRAIRREDTPDGEPAQSAPPAPRSGAPTPSRSRADLLSNDALNELAAMDESAFADAFQRAVSGLDRRQQLESGDQVTGRIVRIGDADLFVAIGGKSEATVDRAEYTDAEGNLTVAVGDEITALVLNARGGEVRLSKRLRGSALREHLEEAIASGIPVDGRVVERNTGGFVIDLGGVRAFCPVSQIDRFPGQDLDRFVGLTLAFRIQEYGGGDAVVSHRAIQEEEVAAQRDALLARLEVDQLHDGVVRSVQPYGAFVDIGGLEGLVHVSEISWGDVRDPTQVVASGDRVRVRVLKIDLESNRISLSMRDPGANPWAQIGSTWRIGQTYEGTVARLSEFGAFVDLAPGLTGLVHRDELADPPPSEISEVVQRGQTIRVRLLSADPERRRLALSLKSADYEVSPASSSGQLGTFADLFKGLKLKG